VTLRKQATLAGVAVFAACGDVALAHGMKSVGPISLGNWTSALAAVFTAVAILAGWESSEESAGPQA